MKLLRILILVLIVAAGGVLKLTAKNDAPADAGEIAGEIVADAAVSDEMPVDEGSVTPAKSGMALVWMKIKGAFTRSGEADIEYAQRDLGRLENHFRPVSDKK